MKAKNIAHLASVLCLLFPLSAALLFSGCKNDPENEPEKEPETFVSNVARPTWTVPSDYDYSSSMTAVIKVANLNGQMVNDQIVNEDDLLAAFSGETCFGIASPQDGLFYLYIAGPTSNSASGPTSNSEAVTLRYWSAHYKNLFEAKDAFVFKNDAHLGTLSAPYIPNFVVLKQ